MKRIYPAAIALALIVGAPFVVFADEPRPAGTSAAQPAAGHTDPDLANLIGIESGYVFPGPAPAESGSSTSPAPSPCMGPRPSSAH
jgi:hypothetical protein